MMQPTRSERLAVNFFDLSRVSDALIKKVLGGKISSEKTACREEVIVPLNCGLETATLALDILRSENRREGIQPVRIYINRKGEWSKLPDDAILTIPYKGRHVFNPVYFPKFESSLEATPLSAEPIRFGGES